MVLNTRNCEAMARVSSEGGSLSDHLAGYDEFTLAGILETIALIVDGRLAVLRGWAEDHAKHPNSPLGKAWQMWRREGAPVWGEDMHGVRHTEYYRLRQRTDRTINCYQLFEERFVRSLVRCGFPSTFAYALAGAFGEMTDNVIQHSSKTGNEFTGIAGYHVESSYVAFSVVDAGQGVLSSLQQSPAWSHLQSSREALRAAVCEHASRRIGQAEGEGFRTLFRKFVDRNGLMRFRSGGSALTIGDGGTHRQIVEIGSTQAGGFQMHAWCALQNSASEQPIKRI